MIAVVVLGAAVVLVGALKLIAIVSRPADRNHVSEAWLQENVRARRDE